MFFIMSLAYKNTSLLVSRVDSSFVSLQVFHAITGIKGVPLEARGFSPARRGSSSLVVLLPTLR